MSKAVQLCAASMLALAGGALAQPAAAATFFFTDTPYRSEADIPAGFYAGGGAPTLLENFEDGSLDASLSASAGSVIGTVSGSFVGLQDSVDGDDGVVDGKISRGNNWFSGAGSIGVTFTFEGAVLPTAFGLVWTDGGGPVTFRATAGNGSLLGSTMRSGFADNSISSTTLEDRFFGVSSAGGIKSIFISNGSGGIEIDHVQYGAMTTPVPLPAAGWLLLSSMGALVARRRAKSSATLVGLPSSAQPTRFEALT